MISIRNIDFSKSQRQLTEKVCLKPSDFGFADLNAPTSPVSVCIVDTGCPLHSGIQFSDSALKNVYVDFYGSESVPWDENGHATAISGVIAGKTDRYSGLCPGALLRYARCIGVDGRTNVKKVAAGMLWGAAAGSDIILVAAGAEEKDRYLEEVTNKCIQKGSIVVAAGKSNDKSDAKHVFPGMFPRVYSACFGKTNAAFHREDGGVDIQFGHRGCWTFSPDDRYIKLGGSSIAAAVLAGIISSYISSGKNRDDIKEIMRNT